MAKQARPSGLLLFLWMVVIFFFSSLAGSPDAPIPTWSYILERKGAHVFEYFVLTILAYSFFLKHFSQEGKRHILAAACLLAFSYAITDELHQFFVPYRGAKFADVLVDLIGIALALLTLGLIKKKPIKNSR